jgi:hypothetical protein
MAKQEQTRPRREDELDPQRTQSYDDPRERPARDTGDWLDAIGPEGMSRDRKIENLEEYGADDDEQLSLESSDQEFGGAYQNGAYTDVVEVGDLIDEDTPLDAEEQDELRPTEAEVIAELDDEDTALDDDMPTGGTQPSGVS